MCGTTVRAELLLPMSPLSPRAARDFARASVCLQHDAHAMDEALLLLSELITNSLRYGAAPLRVVIECVGPGTRVCVRDGDTALPRQRQASRDDETGRGLALVDALSQAWGVKAVDDEHGVGKAVWFELRPPTQAEPPAAH